MYEYELKLTEIVPHLFIGMEREEASKILYEYVLLLQDNLKKAYKLETPDEI